MQDQPLAALAALGDGVGGRMVDSQHGFLDGGDDTMDDGQRKELARPLGHNVWGVVQGASELASRRISRAIPGPVALDVAQRHGVLLREVGRDPSNNQVNPLDELPQVPVDALGPVVGHRAMTQLLKPELQI